MSRGPIELYAEARERADGAYIRVMARLTCTEGGSSKFWEGWVEGRTLFVRFGKIGTDGQTREKKLATPAAAAAELAKVSAEKRKKGYVEAGAKKAAAKPKPAAKVSAKPAAKPKPAAKAKGGKSQSMAQLWARLEAFVAETPQSLHLRPGTTEKAIRAAERTMGLTFPADFRESLLVHDGQETGDGSDENTFPWLTGHPRLASLDRIVAAWKDQCETFEQFHAGDPPIEIDDGRMIHYLWHARRIPIAGNPWWDQDNTYLDFLPGPRGFPGQLVCFGKGYVDGLWCAPSFGSAFALWVDALVSGAWLWEKGCFAREADLHARKRRGSWKRHAAKHLAQSSR